MMTPDHDRRTANRHPDLTADLRRIIGRYGMRGPTNGVILCAGDGGDRGKVCYPSQFTAGFAADAINELDGADRVVPYACPHGSHYHHVSADRRRRTLAAMAAVADAERRSRSIGPTMNAIADAARRAR